MANVAGYDEVSFVQRYCDKNYTGKKMKLSNSGPYLPITLVASDVYPVETADIKKDYLVHPGSATVHPSFNTLTIQHPGKLGQEAEAKKVWPNSCSSAFVETWT